MGQKKRIRNKQNVQPMKKTLVFPINHTQQLFIPTINTIDLKGMPKSIQLRKSTACSKKPASRKSGCTSVKQKSTSVKQMSTQPVEPLKYKQLLKRFEQLKSLQFERSSKSKSSHIQLGSRSQKQINQIQARLKSKSPKSKSKGGRKNLILGAKCSNTLIKNLSKNTYTLTSKNIGSNKSPCQQSRMSLTHKLQRTLKKLNQNFDKDEQDSLLPFVSTDDNLVDNGVDLRQYFIIEDQMDLNGINIGEIRNFCRNNSNNQESQIRKSVNYFRGDQYQMMATKIQRAYRRYRTKKLVERYADIFHQTYVKSNSHHFSYQNDESSSYIINNNQSSQDNQLDRQDIERDEQDNQLDRQDMQLRSLQMASVFNEQQISQTDQKQIRNSQIIKFDRQKHYELNRNDLFEQQVSQKQNSNEQSSSLHNNNSQQAMIKTQELYTEQISEQDHLITYISNLEEDQQNQIHQYRIHQDDINKAQEDMDNEAQEDMKSNAQYVRDNQRAQNDYDNELKQQRSASIIQKIFQETYKQAQQQSSSTEKLSQYQSLLKQLKENQLQKWKQLILLLQQSKQKKSPQQLQSLLKQLTKKSQKNRKELEIIGRNQKHQTHRKDQKRKLVRTEEDDKIRRKQYSGPSETSDLKKEEEFDSRKYIEYLDSDMFLFEKEKSSDNSDFHIHDDKFGRKISKRKQKQLLATLNVQDSPPIRLRCHNISKSQNLSYLSEQCNMPPISRRLKRSISQKSLQKLIKSISPQLQYRCDEQDNLNLQLIRRQFLENSDQIKQLQQLHSNAQLRRKIKDSREESNDPPVRISLDLSKNFKQQSEQQEHNRNAIRQSQNQHQKNQYQHQAQYQHQTKNQAQHQSQKQNQTQAQGPFQQYSQPKIILHQEELKNISDEQENSQDQQENYKADNVCVMIFNFLIFEVLKEMAAYDAVLQRFKNYSISKKALKRQTKKGFPTTHHDIKSFIDALITYLLNQEPQVFKNLQVPAGPTAIQMLHYMHPPSDDQDELSQSSQDESSVMVIPNRMFEQYWVVREKALVFQEVEKSQNPKGKKQNHQFMKGLNKIFWRSIFDCFGQCLDFERNYGQTGKPYPWKLTSVFHHQKTFSQIQKSIGSAQRRLHQISTTYCGLIIQKNDMANQEYIQHVQEDRMSKMLAHDLIDGEERWTFYDDEELETLVETGNSVVLLVLQEVCDELLQLIMRQSQFIVDESQLIMSQSQLIMHDHEQIIDGNDQMTQ